LLTQAGSAEAHVVAARLGDFYTGALHPLTDPQDLVLWTALGLFAGSIGADRGRWLVLVMPLGLTLGFSTELAFGLGSVGTLGAAALMISLGLLLAAGIRAGGALVCAIGLLVAVTRGAINADGTTLETNRVLFAAGLSASGYIVITLIMAVTVAFRRASAEHRSDWRGIALRVCGSWIAAIGLMIGGFALKSWAG
jgi:hydrogenase/urease accessory protein HupE